jgi:FHS family glucose/mannose:H+ symporter-like MFS transporter
MFLNYCVYSIQLSSVGIAVLQVQRSFGVSVADAATLAFYKGLGIFLGAVVVGSFVKRIGYRRSMLMALGGSTAVLAAVPAIVSFTMMKVVFLVTGTCYGLIKVAMYSTIGLISPDRKAHASLLSFVEACYKVGSLMTFLVFGAFTDNLHPESTSWANAYLALAALTLTAFILLATSSLDESAVREPERGHFLKPVIDMVLLARTPLALALGVLVVDIVVTEHGFMNWLPTFNSKVFNLTPSLGIQLAGIYAVWAVIGRTGIGFLVRRVDWFRALVVCVVGAGAVLSLTLLFRSTPPTEAITRWTDAPLTVLVLPFAGLFVAPVFPVIHSAALTSLPVERHSTLASLSVFCSSIAGAFGTPVLGIVFQHYGGVVTLYSLLIPISALLLGIVVMRQITQSQKTAQPTRL